jgi:hypothetical protein
LTTSGCGTIRGMTSDELAQRANEIAADAAAAAWWAAAGAWVTTLLTVGLLIGAVLAWRTAKDTLGQTKVAHKQMEADSIEQTRPYVYAHLVPGLAGIGTWDLLITNTGKSPARNLTIECDALPESDDILTGPLRTLFSTPRSLPPGANVRTYWKVGLRNPDSRWADGTRTPMGIVNQAKLSLRYTSDDPSKPSYQDEYILDDATIGQTPAPWTGPDMKQGLSPEAQDLHKVLAAIAANIGELRR